MVEKSAGSPVVTTAPEIVKLLMELRQGGITDTKILQLIETIPRESFLSGHFQSQAYDNIALPIEQGQTISQPFIVAFMTQELGLSPSTKVLEIGTGSGYQTMILAKLCRRVYTIERYRSLKLTAEARFKAERMHNVFVRCDDGHKGWPEQAPFERIIVTAAAEQVPEALLEQLAEGGRMVIPLGPPGEQQLMRIIRSGDSFGREPLLPVRFVPLVEGIPKAKVS